MVWNAAKRGEPRGNTALAELCERYWYPIYAFVRRRGYSAADAEDLTQEFFSALLEKEYLFLADPARGKFRTFLLTAVTRFLSKQNERASAKKRGGGRKLLSIDLRSAEGLYLLEPATHVTPERLFERRWAMTLLNRVLDQLAADYSRRGKERLFEELKGQLVGPEAESSQAELAAELNMTPGAVKVAIHRLRQRFGEMLKNEIASTVDGAEEVEDEMRSLLMAVQGPPAG